MKAPSCIDYILSKKKHLDKRKPLSRAYETTNGDAPLVVGCLSSVGLRAGRRRRGGAMRRSDHLSARPARAEQALAAPAQARIPALLPQPAERRSNLRRRRSASRLRPTRRSFARSALRSAQPTAASPNVPGYTPW